MSKETKKAVIDFKAIFDKAEAKRIELETKLKCKVKMAVLTAGANMEPCICYFRLPTTATKLKVRDLMYQSPSKAEVILFESTIIREESDKRVFTQDNDEDYFYIGALHWLGEQFTQASVYEKKN